MTAHASQQFTLGATEVRNHLGDLLKRVYGGKEHLVVEKGGIPVAALIGIREYEQFQRWQAQAELQSLGESLASRAEEIGMDETLLETSLEKDRQAIYRQQYGA